MDVTVSYVAEAGAMDGVSLPKGVEFSQYLFYLASGDADVFIELPPSYLEEGR